MNSTVQCLRTIPELQTALQAYSPGGQSDANRRLTAEMRRLYQSMGQTTERMIPAMFLERLRVVAPQFAEQRPGQGYAQQGRQGPTPYSSLTHLYADAEECLGSILNSLRQSSLNVPAELESAPGGLVEKYLMGEMTAEFVCPSLVCSLSDPVTDSNAMKLLTRNRHYRRRRSLRSSATSALLPIICTQVSRM
jgi:ubiquitin carboxyl-terminal hydrolase 14